jgi:hypothetical protein
VTDEVVRRTLAAGGRVLVVRADEVPGDGPAAAVRALPALSVGRPGAALGL